MNKMIKKVILSLLILAAMQPVYAEIRVKSIDELINDISARTNPRTDYNNKYCAIVKVDVPSINNLQFDTHTVGDIKNFPGEYVLYIPQGTESLEFTMGEKKYVINFRDYDIQIKEKGCYRIIMEKSDNQNAKSNTGVTILGNYDGQTVLVDGKPIGQTPIRTNSIKPGKHHVSVANTMGITMDDIEIEVVKGRDNVFNLNMKEKNPEPLFLEIAVNGGDTSGWIPQFGVIVKEKNGKKGLVDYFGSVLIPFEFDYIYPEKYPNDSYFVSVRKNGRELSGLYQPGKGLIIPCIYDAITYGDRPGVLHVTKDGKKGLIDYKGKEIIPPVYKSIAYDSDYMRIGIPRPNSNYIILWGIASYDGKIIIDPSTSGLTQIGPYREGFCVFEDRNGQGLIDINGKKTYLHKPYSFSNIGSYWKDEGPQLSEGLLAVHNSETDKWGFCNSQLDVVVPFKYQRSSYTRDFKEFINGVVLVYKDKDEYYPVVPVVVNREGEEIIDSNVLNLENIELLISPWGKGDAEWKKQVYDNMYFLVKGKDYTEGVYDTKGNIVIPLGKYLSIWGEISSEGIIFVAKNAAGNQEVLDSDGSLIFTLPEGLGIINVKDDFIQVKDFNTSSYGYLDMEGNILANCIYSEDYIENLDWDSRDYLSTLIEGYPISEGLAILNIGDKFGFIDNKGNMAVPLIYTAVTPFNNGTALVRDKVGKWHKLNRRSL